MTCLTNGQAIKRDNHQKEKSFMLVWQKPSKWSKWWWKEDFFKSNHSMLVEAWKKLFAINDWWSLLDDLISPIIHQASATFHNCIHVQFIGQSHDNMSTRRKFFIKRGVVDLKFWIHSWDRKCKPKWQKPFVSCL